MYCFQKSRPTIGFLVNQFEGHYQTLLVKGVIDEAERKDANILIFDGRDFGSPQAEENHNAIYNLAHKQRLDGLIITGGIITNYIDTVGAQSFLSIYKNIPLVTLNLEIPDIACIFPDNYLGMKAVVRHMIEFHGYRRIVFVKGPPYSQEAGERFKAYEDTLSEYGIEYNENLVYSGDFSFRGGLAFAEKFAKKGRLPFEAVIFANDEMALTALRWFRSNKWEAPKDYAISGFDDIIESHLSSPALTTVHQPIHEQGITAIKLVLDMILGKKVPHKTVLPTRLVVRESCGCLYFDIKKKYFMLQSNFEQNDKLQFKKAIPIDKKILEDKENIVAEIIAECACEEENKKDLKVGLSSIIDMLSFDLKNFRKQPMSIMIFSEWLGITLSWNFYNEIWQDIISLVHERITHYLDKTRDLIYLLEMKQKMLIILSQFVQKKEALNYQKFYQFILDLSVTVDKVHSTLDKAKILSIIRSEIKRIGFKRFFLMLYEGEPLTVEGVKTVKNVQLAVVLDEKVPVVEHSLKEYSKYSNILPPSIISEESRYCLVWMELFHFNEHFGYLGMELTDFNYLSYYLVCEKISIALHSALLLQKYKASEEKMQKVVAKIKADAHHAEDLLTNIPLLLIETDLNLNIRFMNTESHKKLSVSSGTNETLSLISYLSNESLKRFREACAQTDSRQDFSDDGIYLQSPTQNKIFPVLKIVQVKDEREELQGFVWYAMDFLSVAGAQAKFGEEFNKKYSLTKREQEIVDQLVQGFSYKEIAANLFLAESTIKGHVFNLYTKLGVNKKSELIRLINEFETKRTGFNNYFYTLISYLLKRR